ncbi:MAG: hypothetical protein H0W88_03190 [Parachlamydiaceae bacterium]|nr:hypothetical protein [Parachlamydiaceae bacterium]
MKIIKALFHFFGGLYFAIFLISITATTIILGTFLEAHTDSHLFAAQFTYGHPFFSVLIIFFFVNILFSALRRWPFKKHHVPFLITHLGLLMLLAGCIIKNWFGIQGNLSITEGAESHFISKPHSYALTIEKKDPSNPFHKVAWKIPFALQARSIFKNPSFSDLQIKVLGFTPHASEKLQTWIKNDHAYIAGIPQIPVQVGDEYELAPLKFSRKSQLRLQDSTLWNLIAIRTDNIEKVISQIYVEDLRILTQSLQEPEKRLEYNFKEIIDKPQSIYNGFATFTLNLHYSDDAGFVDPSIQLKSHINETKKVEDLFVKLNGNDSLYTQQQENSFSRSPSYKIDLWRPNPILLLIEDLQGDSHLFAFDQHGRVHAESYNPSKLRSLAVYDGGFGGYSVQSTIPFPHFPSSRKDKESADLHFLSTQLRQALESQLQLSPPLLLLKNACDKVNVNFVSTFLEFLTLWNNSVQMLMPIDAKLNPLLLNVLNNFDWNNLTFEQKQGCLGVCMLFERLQEPLARGDDIVEVMKKNKWPLIAEINKQNKTPQELLPHIAQQMFMLSEELPPFSSQNILTPNDKAHLFSAFLLAYGIDYQSIYPFPESGEENFDRLIAYHSIADESTSLTYEPIILEAPVTPKHRKELPKTKLEDLSPLIFIEAQKGEKKQIFSLAYDPFESSLKWPILNGEYLVRFQQQEIDIPYRIRLRQARQINYTQSNQPESYECDIVVTSGNQPPVEKTLSMNHVYETWEGYRFYLAGMMTSESGLKRVQLVVNYDPTKYYLTYPGALTMSLGIILLFWLRPYRKK